ncbi:hypothetical protein WK64_09670 [Burkholderia ubonensis]|nr:hypothetical protein WK64_09670 [Burkholderia ubonensis]KVU37183.1 hypothetical protein WK65_22605 [Burkholderia ubonensis]
MRKLSIGLCQQPDGIDRAILLEHVELERSIILITSSDAADHLPLVYALILSHLERAKVGVAGD